MNTENSGLTAQVSRTLEAYAIGGVEESDVAYAREHFQKVMRSQAWQEAKNAATQYLTLEERGLIMRQVLFRLVGEKLPPEDGTDESKSYRWGRVTDIERLASLLHGMLRKNEAPFFETAQYWKPDGDEAYIVKKLFWKEFWQYPSHEDDILHDLGVAGQIVLTLLAACPVSKDYFCERLLEDWEETTNIFGEDPQTKMPYGTLSNPAVEAWLEEALR